MQLGWIDFSKEDRQKAFDVINLLSEQGAVDELGIGVIRDAFANYFFPGTSTIQTTTIMLKAVRKQYQRQSSHFWNPKILRMPYGMQYHLVEIRIRLVLLQEVLQKHFMGSQLC